MTDAAIRHIAAMQNVTVLLAPRCIVDFRDDRQQLLGMLIVVAEVEVQRAKIESPAAELCQQVDVAARTEPGFGFDGVANGSRQIPLSPLHMVGRLERKRPPPPSSQTARKVVYIQTDHVQAVDKAVIGWRLANMGDFADKN